jgi:hypothetical protein
MSRNHETDTWFEPSDVAQLIVAAIAAIGAVSLMLVMIWSGWT